MKIIPIFCLILAHQGKIYLHIQLDLNPEIHWDPQPRASGFYWYFCLTAQKELLQWRWVLLVLTFLSQTPKDLCTAATILAAWIKSTKNLSSGRQVFATRSTWGLIQKVFFRHMHLIFGCRTQLLSHLQLCNSCNSSAAINFTDLGRCSSPSC